MVPIKTKEFFWRFTLKDILTLLCSAAIPLALAIYTSTNYKQQQEQAEKTRQFDLSQTLETRQQTIYDKFLNNIYKLDRNGYLATNKSPWALANAYYRAAHRHWDSVRKADILQFLKEKQLIGKSNCSENCRKKLPTDIIRLNELNFDNITLASETGMIGALKLDCVTFNRVSLNNAKFSFVNLDGTYFDGGRLNYARFEGSSLKCASFIGISLQGVDFGDAILQDVLFSNVDLSTAKLTEKQLGQAIFHNCTLPKGISNRVRLRTTSMPEETKTPDPTKEPMTTADSEISAAIKPQARSGTAKKMLECGGDENLVTFDDLSTGGPVPDGYHGIRWINAWYADKRIFGNYSEEYVSYNRNGLMMVMESAEKDKRFTFKSSAIAAAWNDNLQLEIIGYRDDTSITNHTFTLQVFAVSHLNFNDDTALDKVTFQTYGGTKNPHVYGFGQEFIMDNICLVFE